MQAPLVHVYRGELVESIHYGSVAVVDSEGRLLAFAGDPALQTFVRSAAKPFQAMPLFLNGGAEELDLSPEEIALICASHGGEPRHVNVAAALLRKGEFDESDLSCPAHIPFDEKVAADLRQSGERPTVLQNNCSGNHAGMLLACEILDYPTENYARPDHPLQQQIEEIVAEFAGLEAGDLGLGTDGCGVPAYAMSLHRAAFAYARLAALADGIGGPSLLDRYRGAAHTVVDAMSRCPEYVAGNWSMTTPLIRSFEGGLVGKEGAEGFYAIAIRPRLSETVAARLGLPPEIAIGVALKVSDGSMNRGRDPAVLHCLEQLGLPIDPSLMSYRDFPIRGASNTEVGRVRSEFELTFV